MGTDQKQCSKCHGTKSLDAFSSDRTKRDGRDNQCRACKAEQLRRYRASNPLKVSAYNRSYRTEHPDRYAASQVVNREIARGSIQRRECERCGSPNAEAHHTDYRTPTKGLEWLCHRCHMGEHAEIRAGKVLT